MRQESLLIQSKYEPIACIQVFNYLEFDKYVQHAKATIVTLKNLLKSLLIKDAKKILSYSKSRKLTN